MLNQHNIQLVIYFFYFSSQDSFLQHSVLHLNQWQSSQWTRDNQVSNFEPNSTTLGTSSNLPLLNLQRAHLFLVNISIYFSFCLLKMSLDLEGTPFCRKTIDAIMLPLSYQVITGPNISWTRVQCQSHYFLRPDQNPLLQTSFQRERILFL